MGKQQRKKRKQTGRRHMVHIPPVGLVRLAPARESKTPFCAYYGPHGETCSSTTRLSVVRTLPGTPPVQYMACPLHYETVDQIIQRFLTRLEHLSKLV